MRVLWSIGFVTATILHMNLPWRPLFIVEALLYVPGLAFKLLDNSAEPNTNELVEGCPPMIVHDVEKHYTHKVIAGQSLTAATHLVPH